jgi:hypothetical protein
MTVMSRRSPPSLSLRESRAIWSATSLEVFCASALRMTRRWRTSVK